MTTLTLPIVVGKKYVRRDGNTVVAQPPPEGYEARCRLVSIDGEFAGYKTLVYAETGRIQLGNYADEFPADLVSDYIEPAKGLTIDQFGKIEEDGSGRLCFSFFRTSGHGGGNPTLPLLDACIERLQKAKQEELDRIANLPKPDPHAENAAEYAKDMAETDKAWERWEQKQEGGVYWLELDGHPKWERGFKYHRKEQA